MLNRKQTLSVYQDNEPKLFMHQESRLIFGVVGRDFDCFVTGLTPYYKDHLTVLMDVVIETAYNFDQFKVYPTCPGQVDGLLKLISESNLVTPSIKITPILFNAIYGIKES